MHTLTPSDYAWAAGIAHYTASAYHSSRLADDMTQEAYIALGDAARTFDGRGYFRGWARARVAGAALDYLRWAIGRSQKHVFLGDLPDRPYTVVCDVDTSDLRDAVCSRFVNGHKHIVEDICGGVGVLEIMRRHSINWVALKRIRMETRAVCTELMGEGP